MRFQVVCATSYHLWHMRVDDRKEGLKPGTLVRPRGLWGESSTGQACALFTRTRMLDRTYLPGWGPEDCGGQGCPGAGGLLLMCTVPIGAVVCGHPGHVCACAVRVSTERAVSGRDPRGPVLLLPSPHGGPTGQAGREGLLPPGRQWGLPEALTAS